MERLTFLFVLSIETKKIKWRDWVAVRWRSIQRWEKEQEWERDSHEIRIAVCATNAEKSIEGCCSVAALWCPMKLDRISSKTNLRLYNNKIFTLTSIWFLTTMGKNKRWNNKKSNNEKVAKFRFTVCFPGEVQWSGWFITQLPPLSGVSRCIIKYIARSFHPISPSLLSIVSVHIDLRRDLVGVVMVCSRKSIAARRK
jgi:hypothetical protein